MSRYSGVKSKQLKECLGAMDKLPSVEEARTQNSAGMTNLLQTKIAQAEKTNHFRSAKLQFERTKNFSSKTMNVNSYV